MVKKGKELTWKPVKLDGALMSNDLDGLIGLEECTDYKNNAIILMEKNKRRKRELSHSASHVDDTLAKKKLKTTAKSIANKSVFQIKYSLSPSKQGSTAYGFVVAADTSDNIHTSNEELNNVEGVNAWGRFGLPKSLLKAIKEQGFAQPTEIQDLSLLPAILGRRDILGAAETGSGKTLAFGIPILTGILKIKEIEAKKGSSGNIKNEILKNAVLNKSKERQILDDDSNELGCVKVLNNVELDKVKPKNPLYALILTPTRELAIQVKNHLIAVAKYTGIKVAVVLGGMAIMKQERILSKGPEIVVATPGRLWELIQEGNSHLSQIDEIRFLAIDETDRMLERGHFQELHALLERLNANKFKQNQRQNFVFSATLTLVHELPKHLIMKKKMKVKNNKRISTMTSEGKLKQIIDMLGVTNPKVVDITTKKGMASTLSECQINCAIEEKDYYVYYFLQRHPGRTLIFCNSIGCVKRITTVLGLLGCKPLALHASMQQRQRLKNLDRFRDNEHGVLIATDVAARGLDIPCVEHVLHYQTPRTSESYVHRSGRTARASKAGITVLLVEPSEIQNYLRLCRTLRKTEDLPVFPVEERILSAVKERVKLARELDKLELRVRKGNSESGWLQKAAEEMDILIDDMSVKFNAEETHNFKKSAEVKRKQLAQVLSQPLFPKGFSGKYPLVSAELGMSLELAEPKEEKAVDALKNSIENMNSSVRKKAKWLFKHNVERNFKGNSNSFKSKKNATKQFKTNAKRYKKGKN